MKSCQPAYLPGHNNKMTTEAVIRPGGRGFQHVTGKTVPEHGPMRPHPATPYSSFPFSDALCIPIAPTGSFTTIQTHTTTKSDRQLIASNTR